jgi:arylsulfatase A-like enzyme
LRCSRPSAVARRLATAVLAVQTLFLGSVPAVAQTGKIQLKAETRGGTVPYVNVRVGAETRSCLAPSGRRSFGAHPTQVATGGRVFVYGRVPSDLVGREFQAEALIWTPGREEEGDEPAVPRGWRRVAVIRSEGGDSFLSETLVVEDLNPGSVATEFFERRPVPLDGLVHRPAPVAVPASARLRFGYTLDETVWDGLATATVEIIGKPYREGVATGERISLFREKVDVSKGPRWFDRAVDLGRLGGSSAVFEFRSYSERRSDGKLQPHVAWSSPEIIRDRGRSAAPAVVLISLDNVRARSLSCCGTDRDTAPFLQSQFGTQGAIFDLAITQSVETIPAAMSLMTGLYPSVHGVQSGASALSAKSSTLAESMASSGRVTAAFVDGGAMAPELGFGRGFDFFWESRDDNPWNTRGRAAPTFDRAISWIEEHSNEPFFVYLQTGQARAPHVPPEDYLELFKDARLSTPSDLDEGALVRYEREIRYLDDVVRKFVVKLDQLVDPDRFLLVVTSGHGESFGEHGALGHGTQLYDESIRIPLMMRGLGIRAGSRYAESVGLIDVAPTILDLAGIKAPQAMQGQSIASSLKSGLPFSLPPRYVEARGRTRRTPNGNVSDWGRPSFAAVDGGRKLIWHSGASEPTFEAYDIVADPEEASNVSGEGAPPWVADLSGDLENYPAACQRVARPPTKEPAIDPASRLKLRALGYSD